MEHVTKTHLTHQLSDNKSFFYSTEKLEEIFQQTLNTPDYHMPHPTKKNRIWLFKKFKRNVGQHGLFHYPCQWVALCVANGQNIVTMYPIKHPNSCSFVRSYLKE